MQNRVCNQHLTLPFGISCKFKVLLISQDSASFFPLDTWFLHYFPSPMSWHINYLAFGIIENTKRQHNLLAKENLGINYKLNYNRDNGSSL
jgi:hypothetical protein